MIPGVGVLYFTSLALQLEGHDDPRGGCVVLYIIGFAARGP